MVKNPIIPTEAEVNIFKSLVSPMMLLHMAPEKLPVPMVRH